MSFLFCRACDNECKDCYGKVKSLFASCPRCESRSKVFIGQRSRFDRPWGISFGTRVMIEGDVYFKLVHDDAKLKLSDYVFVGKGCELDVQESVIIGPHTLLAPGCFITDHNHGTDPDKRVDQQPCKADPVVIGQDVWLGTGVVVLPGVTIGDSAVVGAHAVVSKDIPSGAIVSRCPSQGRSVGGPER